MLLDTARAALSGPGANVPSQGGKHIAPMLEHGPGKSMIDFDRDLSFQQRMLDALDARSKATLHNLANQNVPGFKRYVVRFEDLVRDAEANGGAGGASEDVQPRSERDQSGEPGQNNVVLLDELAVLGKTSLMHDVVSRRLGAYFTTLNKAVFGR